MEIRFPPLADLMKKFGGTKSAVMRHLATEYGHGPDRNLTGVIAQYMGVRYQHVRNVLTAPLKKESSGRTVIVVNREDGAPPTEAELKRAASMSTRIPTEKSPDELAEEAAARLAAGGEDEGVESEVDEEEVEETEGDEGEGDDSASNRTRGGL